MRLTQCVWIMIRRRPQVYLGLFLNAVVVTAVLFAYVGLYWQPDLAIFQHALRKPFWVICGLLVGVSFLALLYFLATLYRRRRRRQLGLFLFLGMRPRQGYAWVATETLVVGGCGIVGGVGLGVAIHMALFSFLQRFPGMSLLFPQYHFPLRALFFTVGLFFGLFVVLAVAIPLVLPRSRPAEPRCVDSEGGMSRYAWISLLALGTIVAICLFLPFHGLPGPPGGKEKVFLSFVLFVFCAGLSFLGIYQFYRRGMMIVAQVLRRWKSFSWQGLRLLWLGVLDRRLRGYAFSFSFLSVWFIGFMIVSCILAVFLHGWLSPGSAWSKHAKVFRGIEVSSSLPRYPQDPAGPFAVVYHWPQPDSGLPAELLEAQQREMAILAKLGWEPFAFSLFSVASSESWYFLFLSWREYRAIQQLASLPALPGAADHVLSSCTDCRGGAIEYALRRRFGATQIRYISPDEVQIPPHGMPFSSSRAGIWILGDAVYERLSRLPDAKQLRYVGYRLPAAGLTLDHLQFLYQVAQESGVWSFPIQWNPYHVALAYEEVWVLGWVMVTWAMLFLSFTVAAGNFLLFRIYLDLGDREQGYRDLLRLGIPVRYICQLVTQQMAVLFFSPLVLSILLSVCALVYAYRLLTFAVGYPSIEAVDSSLVMPISGVFVIFLCAQGLVFLLVRKWVVRNVARRWAGS